VLVTITERGHDNGETRHSDEWFRSLVQNLADIVTIFDADGAVRFVSPSVEHVLGYKLGARLEGNVFAFVHPDDVARARSAFGRVATQPGYQGPVQLRARHADGSWRVLEVSANNLLADPHVRGIVGIARDITQRKRVEDVLRFLAEANAALTGALDGEMALAAMADAAARQIADWCLVERPALLPR
jgi:PAS domain S-box-containing protein